MKVINFYGSSGSGKSTAAVGLAYALKLKGFKVEVINEYAKELCLSNSEHLLENQLWVFANQYQKMRYLSKDLDYVVVDSPLLLASYYGLKYGFKFETLYPLIDQVSSSFENINLFLDRNHDWDSYARIQTESESNKDSKDLEIFLTNKNITVSKFETGSDLIPNILKYLNI